MVVMGSAAAAETGELDTAKKTHYSVSVTGIPRLAPNCDGLSVRFSEIDLGELFPEREEICFAKIPYLFTSYRFFAHFFAHLARPALRASSLRSAPVI